MTRNQPKDERIRQILEAAVSEFLDRGYEGASVDSIAKRAGLTKGGVYHHFRNKDEILRAANDLFQKPIERLAARSLAAVSPVEGLRVFIHAYVAHWASHAREIAFVFLSLSKVLAVAELWPMMRGYYEQGIADYRRLLDRAVAQGELKPHDTHGRALALMCALDGITPYLVTLGESLDTDAVARQLEAALITDLRVDAAVASGESEG